MSDKNFDDSKSLSNRLPNRLNEFEELARLNHLLKNIDAMSPSEVENTIEEIRMLVQQYKIELDAFDHAIKNHEAKSSATYTPRKPPL